MYTYVLKCHDLYKIGKAINVQKRIKSFECGNPFIEHIKTIEGDYEAYLHAYYKEKRVKNEWFKLSEDDIVQIETVITNTQPRIPNIKTYENIQGCECEKQYWTAMMALKSLGVMDRRVDIENTETFDYQIWYEDLLVDSCRSGADKVLIMKVGEKKEPVTEPTPNSYPYEPGE